MVLKRLAALAPPGGTFWQLSQYMACLTLNCQPLNHQTNCWKDLSCFCYYLTIKISSNYNDTFHEYIFQKPQLVLHRKC